METDFTWDTVKSQVKKLRNQAQAHYNHFNTSSCKNFYFVPDQNRAYFLAYNDEPRCQRPRYLELFHVDYVSLATPSDRSQDTPVRLQWQRTITEYTTPDPTTGARPFTGLSSFQIAGDIILLTHMGNLYAGSLNKVPCLIPSQRVITSKKINDTARSTSLPTTSIAHSHESVMQQRQRNSYCTPHGFHGLSIRYDPKLGGVRNNLIAFIRERDIWVSDLAGVEMQLTLCSDQANDALSCGVAEYIMQEEFHRYSGYCWQPPIIGDALSPNCILYLETDERQVDWIDFSKGQGNAIKGQGLPPGSARYPRAGRPNASSTMCLVEFDGSYPADPPASAVCRKRLWGHHDLDYCYPWCEYIVRFGWLPDGKSVWAQLLSRDQKTTTVIRIPRDLFQTQREYREHPSVSVIEELWAETSNTWINISDAYYFLDGLDENGKTCMIWSSERDGFRHLYYVEKTHGSSSRIQQLTHGNWCVLDKPIAVDPRRRLVYFMAKRDSPLEAQLYVTTYDEDSQQRPLRRLTQQGFHHTVDMSPLCDYFVDTVSDLHQPHGQYLHQLHFHADDRLPWVNDGFTGDHFHSNHLCNHSGILLPAKDDVPGTQQCDVFGNDDQLVLAPPTFSRTCGPRSCPSSSLSPSYLRNGPPALPADLLSKPTPKLASSLMSMFLTNSRLTSSPSPCQPDTSTSHAVHQAEKFIYGVPKGELFDFTSSDGIKLHGCLYRPRFYQPGVSYPTLVHIYGGPKSQMVTNEFRFPRVLRYSMAAYFGFAVVVVDGRGSCDRGMAFESHMQFRLGQVELLDQIDGLHYLSRSRFGALPTEQGDLVSVIDLDRVAVTGWSYGGYLSLLALAQYPDVFKIAIAGAPVTDWCLYDSAYSERYMGTPLEQPTAYDMSSVLHYAKDFPTEEHRLIVVHGLIDENVHFSHTEDLVALLDKHEKPYHLQVYPTEKHGLRHASVNEHFDTLMYHCLVNYL
ncbi:hypothetical protein DM01DRAFT_1332653 [Hesseltinella vesiculosa]|uniref:Alpha/beta-hydrolase n=1 Tax=Hesseltinella vesiculosa TaxID=101127 RepID=A0A1X2GSR4_9FUNG|nr:hypothetical protein DM01DRAFT_1332653 [Hesseltinella vesiculosa]